MKKNGISEMGDLLKAVSAEKLRMAYNRWGSDWRGRPALYGWRAVGDLVARAVMKALQSGIRIGREYERLARSEVERRARPPTDVTIATDYTRSRVRPRVARNGGASSRREVRAFYSTGKLARGARKV